MAHAVQVALGGAPRNIGRFAVASDPHVFLSGVRRLVNFSASFALWRSMAKALILENSPRNGVLRTIM